MKILTIFLDGQYKKISQDALKVLSPGVLKGLGVFETLLCQDGKVFFFREHYRRFLHGCDRYVLPKPLILGEIKNIVAQLLRENKLKDGRVRLAAWRRGWELHFAIVVIPHCVFPSSVYERGFCACIYPKRMDRSFELAKVKSLDYGFFLKAYEYALEHDCHEAVFLNSAGEIVEGSRSNIFFVKDAKLLTAPLSSGCLAGVTRQAVLSVAKSLKIKTALVVTTLESFQNSDEAFLTNALIGIMPLTKFSGHKIGIGRPGPLTLRLFKSYKKLSQAHSTFLV